MHGRRPCATLPGPARNIARLRRTTYPNCHSLPWSRINNEVGPPALLAEWVRLAPPAGRSRTAAGRVRRRRDRSGMSHACGARPTRTAILSSGPGSMYEVGHPARLAERSGSYLQQVGRARPPAVCDAAGTGPECRTPAAHDLPKLPSSTREQDQHTGLFTRASWRSGSGSHLQQVGRARPQAVCDAAGTGPECRTPAAHDLPEPPSSPRDQDQYTRLFTRPSWRRGSGSHLQQVGRARPQAVCDAAGTGPECRTPAAHDLPNCHPLPWSRINTRGCSPGPPGGEAPTGTSSR
ncbi:hypothetical protein KBTX_03124 [wastewater metagenome]|uniref:Uncharacterized protein n=2 Tax=unclassified sequences TaxID=12908 RepID=A0A5B8RFJ9_9ZZZZ|nr:hypothetical protein KBTEX_03124 [uncultured organism]